MVENQSESRQERRNFNEVVNNYEQLIKSTQDELSFYKSQQQNLKKEISKLIEENQVVHAENNDLQILKAAGGSSERYEKLTTEAIQNLKEQIRKLVEERNSVQSLWKTSQETIHYLEREILGYRNQILKPDSITEIKKKYENTVDLLENTVKTLRHELNKQSTACRDLVRSKQVLEERIGKLENKCLEQEKTISDCKKVEALNTSLQTKLSITMKTNHDLEKSLKVAKAVIDERLYREREALEKVQEALAIAESAMAEKEDALKREKVIREECNQLAGTIGQVMEDAAIKVEKNIENIRAQYEEQIRTLKESQKESKIMLENQKKLTNLAEVRTKTIEGKLKELIQENLTLDADLQIASQAIIELELKVETIGHLTDKDHKHNRISEEREQELQNFIISSKHLKDRWKKAIEDISNKFQQEILHLQKENTSLKLENQDLKLKIQQQQ